MKTEPLANNKSATDSNLPEISTNEALSAALETVERPGVVLIGSGAAGREFHLNSFHPEMNGDWAITEDAFVRINQKLQDLPTLMRGNFKSLEAVRSEYLEKTFSVKIRNGVAIIPVTGPIFRYFNWYCYWYGGASCDILARDFNAALANPSVYAIVFVFDTPGGQVAGINELGKMIYQARKKNKVPLTAYVDGMMCSAGLWLGAMCGDIVLDQTAQIGSYGVMTTYYDTRKLMKDWGVEEIQIIASQSPKKNLPPYSDEGRAAIQKRIDKLAGVFAENLALGREVDVKTVYEKFGQGEVFVGDDAIDAGLADRFGSFEETLYLLAKTHNPGFDAAQDDEDDEDLDELIPEDEDDEDDEARTINSETILDSQMDAETSAETLSEGENMSDTKVKAEETATAEPQVQTENKVEPPAANTETEDFRAKYEAAMAELDQQKSVNAKTQERVAALEAENLNKDLIALADDNNFAGDKNSKVEFMSKLVNQFGRESAEFKAYVEDQKALAAQIKTGNLFGEFGASGAESEGAAAKLDELAKAKKSKEKGMSYEQAYRAVCEENSELYALAQAEAQ